MKDKQKDPRRNEPEAFEFPWFGDSLYFPYYDQKLGVPVTRGPSAFDPQGSYTGIPLDGELPVQDADDL